MSAGPALLVEHTIIEAYPDQTSEGIKFARLAPLIEAIEIGVPDVAFRVALSVDYYAHLRSATDDQRFVDALASELQSLAAVMAPGERRRVAVGPIDVFVNRRKHPHPRPVWVLRIWPAPGRVFADMVRERLVRKAKKFDGRPGRRLLILEVKSIAVDLESVKEAARRAHGELAAYDDVVVLETDEGEGPWFAYSIWLDGQSTDGLPQEIPVVGSDLKVLTPGWELVQTD